MASAHGLRTGPERSAYAMSKGAILALTRALAVELVSPENTFTTGQTLVIDGGATSMIGG